MPVLDKYGTTKKIREISSSAPIIAVTAPKMKIRS
ncbi:MAG: hypothetical protein DBY02_09825 [Coprobacter fastidiosus]|nr:MAG: hypothetical protein DBY02_09825 [Coprobacter fastidiosus]